MGDKKEYSGLSTRSANCLKVSGFETKGQVLAALEAGKFHRKNIPGLGDKSLKEIMEWVGFSGKTKDKRIYSAEQSILNYINSVVDRLYADKIEFGSVTGMTIEIDETGNVSGVIINTSK